MSKYEDFWDDRLEDDNAVEQWFDEFVEFLKENYDCDEEVTSVVNPKRLKTVVESYATMKKMAKGKDIEVFYRINEPFIGSGSVSMIGKKLVFPGTDMLRQASKGASNIDIYPKTDGTVQIDFGFHHLCDPID